MINKSQHLIIDLVNLDKSTCLNGEGWIEAFTKSSKELGLEIISSYSHTFEPPKAPGVTAYLLLDSSHFSIHTYADSGEAALDLFACTNRDISLAFSTIREMMRIEKNNISMVREIRRFDNDRP